MTKIKTNDDSISNIELMMKFCSKLHQIIRYPYYFNWSTATNYYDVSPDGELHDIGYAWFSRDKGVEIKSWKDVEAHKGLIMLCINEYIAEDDKQ